MNFFIRRSHKTMNVPESEHIPNNSKFAKLLFSNRKAENLLIDLSF